MRTKSDWKEYQEAAEKILEDYHQQNPTNQDFSPTKKSLIKQYKDKLPFGSKNNDKTLDMLISGEHTFANISQDFDEWSIYFLAHKVSGIFCPQFLFRFSDDGNRKLEYCKNG